jgi:hypothetical protein
VKKGKKKNSEVVMRKNMQWWGFLEMLGFDQNPGGIQVNSDKPRQESMVHRKSRFGFKRARKDVTPVLLTDAFGRSHARGGNSFDTASRDEVQYESVTLTERMSKTGDSSTEGRV